MSTSNALIHLPSGLNLRRELITSAGVGFLGRGGESPSQVWPCKGLMFLVTSVTSLQTAEVFLPKEPFFPVSTVPRLLMKPEFHSET